MPSGGSSAKQSAKSLRGGEMADVIFNGSTPAAASAWPRSRSSSTTPAGSLATDADEVQITRRVYRAGEGEYLINSQPCRLKDIKDLFLGSGAGTDAYCIIEQGRVDVLLQASTRDRRTIFEEAAGISRFKAEKIETLRRLERVEPTCPRSATSSTRSKNSSAASACRRPRRERYQEYSNRLAHSG